MMQKRSFQKFFIMWLVLISVSLVSCNEVARVGMRYNDQNLDNNKNGNGNIDCPVGVNCATPTDGSVGSTDEEIIPKVEIRHLIEPKIDDDDTGGDYTRKLTIPKNYHGLLYLAGINVTTLADKNVKVRFNFGVTGEPITVPATVSQAAGLTPQTSVEVLVMDLRYRPFEDVQLIYDLFDYNEYTFRGSSDVTALDEPVQDNRNEKLFCRGLSLKDDPTFEGQVADGCKDTNDVCKYAYAKIVDKGLVRDGTPAVPITPQEPNIQSGTEAFYKDDDSIMLNRCLPDNPASNTYVYKDDPDSSTISLPYGASTSVNSEDYYFLGPYRPINEANWEITSNAIFSTKYGVFGDSMSGTLTAAGIKSLMFPVATKFDLPKDVEYLGSNNPEDSRSLMTMTANTESNWMDGCNLRATTVDTNTGEHVGSCNVTATIDIITVDDSGKETVVDSSIDVKLQLVKPQEINTEGDNVLLSSFQSCTSSNQCGSDSCCFNGRCWSKSLVSQCMDDLPSYGNLQPGASCTSDFMCASLCCNQGTGKCAVHDTLQDPEVLCSKPSGQFCIAKEWCMKHTVTECYIVKTGFTPTGATTCALRCYTSQIHGDCESGICKPPPQPELPVFNPNDPNQDPCANAIDPLDEDDLLGGAGQSNNGSN
jgi:hypothetical protein